MSIQFQSEMKDGILVVTASGRDDNVQQVIDYGHSVERVAIESGARCVLCDERNLQYAIDTFDAARQIAASAPKAARIAIVCRPECLEDGKFWETVAVNRGMQVRMDTDFVRAEAWLREFLAQPDTFAAGDVS